MFADLALVHFHIRWHKGQSAVLIDMLHHKTFVLPYMDINKCQVSKHVLLMICNVLAGSPDLLMWKSLVIWATLAQPTLGYIKKLMLPASRPRCDTGVNCYIQVLSLIALKSLAESRVKGTYLTDIESEW